MDRLIPPSVLTGARECYLLNNLCRWALADELLYADDDRIFDIEGCHLMLLVVSAAHRCVLPHVVLPS